MKFFVSTGEVSGDLHLSYLVEAIKKKYRDVEFYGVAGRHSRNVGVEVIQDIDELAIMGFTEVLKKYSFLFIVIIRLFRFYDHCLVSIKNNKTKWRPWWLFDIFNVCIIYRYFAGFTCLTKVGCVLSNFR